MSRSSGGPLPTGNGSHPIHSCPCGAMYSGGSHVCRTADKDTDRETEREAG